MSILKQIEMQTALKQSFPEFQHKKVLIEYYICFEFPEKQVKMVSWWQKVIEFIMEKDNQIYITYGQLVNYISIYNLKPVPLEGIINYLSKKNTFVEENQIENQAARDTQNRENKTSWFQSALTYLTKAKPQPSKFTFQPTDKIFSKKLKDSQKERLKMLLLKTFSEHCKSMDEFCLNQILQSKLKLDYNSVKQLLNELNFERAIKIASHNQQRFVLYSPNPNQIRNSDWIELESMKFKLKQHIHKLQYTKSIEEQQISSLYAKAREYAHSNNKVTVKIILRQMREKQKKMSNISTRKNLIENQLTQLQYNEMNKSTISLLEESNKIYQQTMVDENKLDQLMQKNMEIQQINKETNAKFQMCSLQEDLQDQVDKLMSELSQQVQESKRKQVQKKKVQVMMPMDIQMQTNRQKQGDNLYAETK